MWSNRRLMEEAMTVIRLLPRIVGAACVSAVIVVGCATPAGSLRPPTSAPTPASTSRPSSASSTAPSTAPTTKPTATPTPSKPAETPAGPVTGNLSVLEWSGYEEELYWADFAEKYPEVDVSFEFGISDADIFG